MRVLANNLLKTPIIDVSRGLQGDEDAIIPLLQDNGGVIKVSRRDNNLRNNLELEVSNLPEGVEIIKKISNQDGVVSYTSALNRDNQGNLLSTLRLNYMQWNDVYLKGAQDVSGDFELIVQAFTVKDSGKEQSTKAQTVDLSINPINDTPSILDSSDLKPINEGELGSWDIASRFTDIDNSKAELKFTARVIHDDDTIDELPAWLTFTNEGVLKGTPTNNDVGEINLLVTATDPLGLQAEGVFFLSVGNINNPPMINHDLDQLAEWHKLNEDGTIKYSKQFICVK